LIQASCNIIKVGVIGNRNFLPGDLSLSTESAFYSANNQTYLYSGSLESNLSEGKQFSSLNELLLHSDVVLVNDIMHSGFSELQHIIRHCKHVFINQPFPLSTEQLMVLHRLAEEAEAVVQIGLPHRFTPIYMSIKQRSITPRLIETNHFSRFNRRSTQISIISDVLLGDIDMIMTKVNSDIKHIHATGVGVIYNDPDIINIRLEFQNGCIANISGSKIAIKDIHKTRFYQNDSYYTLDHLSNSIKTFHSTDASFWENTDESDGFSEQIDSFTKTEGQTLINSELDSFFNAIALKTKSPASLYDHLAIKFVAERIYDQLERNFVGKCG